MSMTNLSKCRYQDVYHRALVYCLGIDRDTREHADSIYNFKSGCARTECLHEDWQTSGSVRIVRMAFNLYCNGTLSVYDYEFVVNNEIIQLSNSRENSILYPQIFTDL